MSLELQALVDMVGVDGARAALRASKKISHEELAAVVRGAPSSLGTSPSRADLVDALLARYESKIGKSLEELQRLSETAIEEYFKKTGCSLMELSLFLDRGDIPHRKGLTRGKLITEAARQIARMGMYEHIAGGTKLKAESLEEESPLSDSREPDGVWYSELGTRIILRFEGDAVHGSYTKLDQSEYKLVGRIGDGESRRAIAFVVVWDGGERKLGAATAWAGHFLLINGSWFGVVSWLTVQHSLKTNRMSISMGRERLSRRSSEAEELSQQAAPLLDLPYPR